jgi:hypothetical protein
MASPSRLTAVGHLVTSSVAFISLAKIDLMLLRLEPEP